MSYGLTANDWGDTPEDVGEEQIVATGGVGEWGLTVLPPDAPAQVRRSAMIPVALAIPVLFSALSYAAGGIGWLSDLAFVVLTITCLTLLIIELFAFGNRLGMGAILMYGGVLIWFCHDYGTNWFLHDFSTFEPAFPSVHVDTVARALFYHCLFIEVMVITFRFPFLRFVDRLVVVVPEPPDSRFYLGLVIALLLIGWSSFIFTSDPLPVSIAKGGLWFVPGMGGGPKFTVARTGNTNTSWGGYVAQIIQVGQIGGILGAVYALLVARTLATRIFGWFVWAYWLAFSFQSYRRGDIAYMALPVLGLLFLKYHAQRDPARRGRAVIWAVGTVLVIVGTVFLVQLQTAQRMSRDGIVHMFRAAGNTMFSEGLNAWVIIPDQVNYPYNTWPGEGVLRPIPDTLWTFVTSPIPRALWTSKPVEQFALWYSAMISHDKRGVASGGLTGTTVSGGAVGAWYFRYGPPGVVEGAIIYGWMMGVAERAMRRAQGQPIKVLFALSFATFVFRCYRDLWFHLLYPVMIGGVVLWLLVKLVFGARTSGTPLVMPATAT